MFTSVYFFLSSSDESECDERVERKLLREKSDPLSLPENIFIQRFRLNKEAFRYVLEKLKLPYKTANAVPPILQLACTLSLLGSGGYHKKIGSDYLFPLAQSTMSKASSITLEKMEDILCFEHIKFDIENNFTACKEFFAKKYALPGVIGCVDSTHISLSRPVKNEKTYVNKNGIHSLNAMIICDHELKINAINCRNGGTVTDAFVWTHCDEREYLEEQFVLNENQDQDCWLLGDAAYSLEPWCITPYRNAAPGSPEERFNKVHSEAYSITQKTIKILKNRWQILLGQHEKLSRYDPERMARFINVCAALHNICIKFKVPFLNKEVKELEEITEIAEEQNNNYIEVAKAIRDQICSTLK
ncbi:putative nuclease HARBI1 [Episyrphus balteatus]|uniref:putative nuclease HARBI1 n=1 Tax=Episyrphus balteatus TaxID=286459 RepID=UPI002485311B|nr:putative nuclease HARBI1 [Episyrphus balteatus]